MKRFRSLTRFGLTGAILGASCGCLFSPDLAEAALLVGKGPRTHRTDARALEGFEIGNAELSLFGRNLGEKSLTQNDLLGAGSDFGVGGFLAPFVEAISGDHLILSRVAANEYRRQAEVRARREKGYWEPVRLGPLLAWICERNVSEARRQIEMHLFRNREEDPKAGSEVLVAVVEGAKTETAPSEALTRSLWQLEADVAQQAEAEADEGGWK